MTTAKCPCGTGREFADCCGPFHANDRYPMTAEELMRSRYSAFVLSDVNYLAQTWHPRTRPRHIRIDVDRQWTGLTILTTEAGGPLHDTGVVEFVATFVDGATPSETGQISEFERIDGKWVYVDEKA